jgi:site-specific recombinase XerD
MDMVDPPRKPRTYPRGISQSAVEKLLKTIDPASYLDYRDRAIIIFLWDTGVRASELCELRLIDVEINQGDGLVEVGKGRKSRTLAFGQKAQALLNEWLDVRGEANCDRVFVNRCRNPLTRSGLYAMLDRRKEEVSIEVPCNPHAFRHGFAIEFLENGGNINNLRILMGHESLRSTEPYLKATDGRARRDHKKASPGDHLNSA